MKITPRLYQLDARNAALNGLRAPKKRALVVMATGLGKTITSALITQEFAPRRVLFLVHNNFILQHAVEEYRLVFEENIKMAVYNGLSKNGAASADIVFATWQTMGSRLDSWAKEHFDLVVVDEAHHSEAETYCPVVEYFSGPRLAITAEPERKDKADIRRLFGKEVYNVALEEAIAKGWLPKVEYHVCADTSLDDDSLQALMREIQSDKKRFTMAEVNRRIFIRRRDEEIARIISSYNEKAVVFCSSIEHAEKMSKAMMFSDTFHSGKGNSAKDTWRKNLAVLRKLDKGLLRRVCAVNAFNEGVNVPSVGLVAFCRATDSATIFRQQLGRGLRPGKERLIVLDFVGNLERLRLIRQAAHGISPIQDDFVEGSDHDQDRDYSRDSFDVSGAGFEFTFSDEVVDLIKALDSCDGFYSTWQEASQSALALKFKIRDDYVKGHSQDERLPGNPRVCYLDFPGWPAFLGRQKKSFYPTWQQASSAALALGITLQYDYGKRKDADPRLPSAPNVHYPDFPNWSVFLGKRDRYAYYLTWEQASSAAQKLGIRTHDEYKLKRVQDVLLPAAPEIVYKNFPGWIKFLGKPETYPTLAEASAAAIILGIRSSSEYLKSDKRKSDTRLPGHPERDPDFPGWAKFLGRE